MLRQPSRRHRRWLQTVTAVTYLSHLMVTTVRLTRISDRDRQDRKFACSSDGLLANR
jgi:hypothetical protein